MLRFGKFMEAAEDCERDGLSDTIPEEGHSRPQGYKSCFLPSLLMS